MAEIDRVNGRSCRVRFALGGAALGLGIPTLFLGVRVLEHGTRSTIDWAVGELAAAPVAYGLLVIATTALLVLGGFWLGRKEDRLRALAVTDGLTGLSNRRFFDERAAVEFHRADRYAKPLSVILIDVDRLKQTNDAAGHSAGDSVIKSVAATIRKNVRASDVAARLGGDEFAILCPETSSQDALVLAERIRAEVRPARDEGFRLAATVSAGLADRSTADAHRIEEIVAAADTALYEAKALGRDRTVRFEKLESFAKVEEWDAARPKAREEKNGNTRYHYAPIRRGGSA